MSYFRRYPIASILSAVRGWSLSAVPPTVPTDGGGRRAFGAVSRRLGRIACLALAVLGPKGPARPWSRKSAWA